MKKLLLLPLVASDWLWFQQNKLMLRFQSG